MIVASEEGINVCVLKFWPKEEKKSWLKRKKKVSEENVVGTYRVISGQEEGRGRGHCFS